MPLNSLQLRHRTRPAIHRSRRMWPSVRRLRRITRDHTISHLRGRRRAGSIRASALCRIRRRVRRILQQALHRIRAVRRIRVGRHSSRRIISRTIRIIRTSRIIRIIRIRTCNRVSTRNWWISKALK